MRIFRIIYRFITKTLTLTALIVFNQACHPLSPAELYSPRAFRYSSKLSLEIIFQYPFKSTGILAVFSAAFLTSSGRGGPLWMSTCGWVQNLCSKSLHLNQTRPNPIICQVSFFFPLEGVCTSHSPSLCPTPRNPHNPHHALPTHCMLGNMWPAYIMCETLVRFTMKKCLLRLCGIRTNTLPIINWHKSCYTESHVWQIWLGAVV